MRHVEFVMGTAVTFDLPDHTDVGVLVDAIERLHDIDQRYSVFRPDSQISSIGKGTLPLASADADVQAVLATCHDLYVATSGAFCHWPGGRERPLDPSGYVKGWAIDQVVADLHQAGVERFFINAGGDIVAYSASDPWRIGIRHPSDPSAVGAVLECTNLAVATSANYERGDHIWGADHHVLTSITVTGPTLGVADALATALWSVDQSNPEWLAQFPSYEVLTFDCHQRRHRTAGLTLVS
ncbi:MAG: FAD:protein FMN transferase [Acidimicrobiales bacterium]